MKVSVDHIFEYWFTGFARQGDCRQIQCQMLDATGAIQFTSNITGSEPLDHGHINRQMCLQFPKQMLIGYELWNGTKMGKILELND